MIVSSGSTLLLVLPPFRGTLAKVRVGERQRAEGEPKLLDTTVGRVVRLLPVAPTRASRELEATVENIFGEGGSGSHTKRGDSVSGGHGVDIPQVSATTEIVAEDAALVQPKRQRKTIISDAGEPSHPPKKLREDHGTLTGPSVAEDGNQSDFMAWANLQTITAPPRFIISSDSSHHSGANIAEAEVDSFAMPSFPLMTMATTVTSTANPTTTTNERFVDPSIFGGGSSSGAEHTVGGFSGLTGSNFIIGAIHTVVSHDTDLPKVYIPQWSVTNGSRLDDGHICCEMMDEFAPPKFFSSIRRMEHDQLFTKFNVGAARQMTLSTEVRIRAEFNIREKRRLCSLVEEKYSLLKARDEEIKIVEKSLQDEINYLKERNTALEKEKGVLDVKNDRLADQVREMETSSVELQEKVAVYENCMSQLEKFQDEQMAVVHEKFNKLDADFVDTCLHLEERFYPHLLTTIAGRRLAAGITHGQEDRVLTDIAAFNPFSNKDASIKAVMDLLRLDEAFSERLGLNDLQPHVDQLMPLSVAALEGTGGTSSVDLDTTTALSVTLAFASTILPISMDDYEIAHAENQGSAGADVDPFLNVDDAELIIS
ncbi:hypothetical protein Tco_0410828 [Tanacetum coccineum]